VAQLSLDIVGIGVQVPFHYYVATIALKYVYLSIFNNNKIFIKQL
jgi:hypothetical protein